MADVANSQIETPGGTFSSDLSNLKTSTDEKNQTDNGESESNRQQDSRNNGKAGGTVDPVGSEHHDNEDRRESVNDDDEDVDHSSERFDEQDGDVDEQHGDDEEDENDDEEDENDDEDEEPDDDEDENHEDEDEVDEKDSDDDDSDLLEVLSSRRRKGKKQYIPIAERLGTRGKRVENLRIRREIRKLIYSLLGDYKQKLNEYPPDKVSKAVVRIYNWCRDENVGNHYDWDLSLCKDLLRDIGCVDRKEGNRESNKVAKARGEVVRRGRPPKPKAKKAPKKPKSTVSHRVNATPPGPKTSRSGTREASSNTGRARTVTQGDKPAPNRNSSVTKSNTTGLKSINNTPKSNTRASKDDPHPKRKQLDSKPLPKGKAWKLTAPTDVSTQPPATPPQKPGVGKQPAKTAKKTAKPPNKLTPDIPESPTPGMHRKSKPMTSLAAKTASPSQTPSTSRKRTQGDGVPAVSPSKKHRADGPTQKHPKTSGSSERASRDIPADISLLDPTEESQSMVDATAADASQTLTDGSHTLTDTSQQRTQHNSASSSRQYVAMSRETSVVYRFDYEWSHGEFMDTMEVMEGWPANATFWYKIGKGSDCIVSMPDEYARMLEKLRAAPKGSVLSIMPEDRNKDYLSPCHSDHEHEVPDQVIPNTVDDGYDSLHVPIEKPDVTTPNDAPAPQLQQDNSPAPAPAPAPAPPTMNLRVLRPRRANPKTDAHAEQLAAKKALTTAKADRKKATEDGRRKHTS